MEEYYLFAVVGGQDECSCSCTGSGRVAEIKGVDMGVLPGDQSFGGGYF
jgi:hypothetical protein